MARLIAALRPYAFAAFVLATLAACAGTKSIQLSAQQRQSISSVSINPYVVAPEDFMYMGAAQTAGAILGGGLGAIIGSGVEEGTRREIIESMRKHQIDIGAIVAAEFDRQLREANLFSSVEPSGGDARFTLEVRVYGLLQCNLLHVPMCPMLDAVARLTRPNGELIWQKHTSIMATDARQRPGQRPDDYLLQPELLRETLQNAAHVVVSEMIMDLKKSSN